MKVLRLAAALVAVLTVAGCGGGPTEGAKQPEGQVIAEVGGVEVTLRELAAELQRATMSDPEMVKAAERDALQAIINRKLLAGAGRDLSLEKTAEFQLARHRSEELLLAQAMQRQIAAKIARPSREEAERYIAANPNNFAQRKIYKVDQLQFSLAGGRHKLNEFAPLRTLDQIEQKLLSDSIDFKKSPGSLDSLNVPPHIVNRIAQVPSGGVFIIPNGSNMIASQIKETQVVPFTGEAAIARAQEALFRDRVAEALSKQAKELRNKAGKVNYKAGYGPPAENAPKSDPAGNTVQSSGAEGGD